MATHQHREHAVVGERADVDNASAASVGERGVPGPAQDGCGTHQFVARPRHGGVGS